eukprot:357245-Chlamydomonas_euryale.AAC.1
MHLQGCDGVRGGVETRTLHDHLGHRRRWLPSVATCAPKCGSEEVWHLAPTSSTMTTSYCASCGSPLSMRNRMPSVMNTMRELGDTLPAKRTCRVWGREFGGDGLGRWGGRWWWGDVDMLSADQTWGFGGGSRKSPIQSQGIVLQHSG